MLYRYVMKKLYLLVILMPLLISCSNNDDDGVDCSLYDPAFPSLFLKMVDEAGNNLIENGTIDPNAMTIEGDFEGAGFRWIPADKFANPDSEIRAFDNTIQLFIPNRAAFQYAVNLITKNSIILNFSSEVIQLPCEVSYSKPIKVSFNNKTLDIKEILSDHFLVVIVL